VVDESWRCRTGAAAASTADPVGIRRPRCTRSEVLGTLIGVLAGDLIGDPNNSARRRLPRTVFFALLVGQNPLRARAALAAGERAAIALNPQRRSPPGCRLSGPASLAPSAGGGNARVQPRAEAVEDST